MMTLLWLGGAFAVLLLIGAWLSLILNRGAEKQSFNDPLNEIQGTRSWWNWGP